jgi:hypothetical protein
MPCAQGALSRLCVEPGPSPHVFDTSSEAYEFLREDLSRTPTRIRSNGIRGTRSRASERTRPGPFQIGGSVTFNPDPAMLDLWLPRILGAPAAGTTFAVAETLPSFGILIDRVTNTFQYKDCVVNQAVLRGRANGGGENPEPLELVIAPLFRGYEEGTAFPAVTLPTGANSAPYIFEDGVFTVDGIAYEIKAFAMAVSNALYARRVNSLYPTALCPTDRVVQLQAQVPYDAAGMVTNAAATKAATLTFTNGAMSFSISLAGLEMENPNPSVRGKTEIDVMVVGLAASVATTKEIVVTNDSTTP